MGAEIMTGGSMIMPMDSSTEATIRSTTRNGRKSTKPSSNARFSSPITKAGIST